MSISARGRLAVLLAVLTLAWWLLTLLDSPGSHALAQAPFTPTFTITADEVAPGDVSVLPVDDDCPVGAACKLLWHMEIPDGQPVGGDGGFGITPSSIVGLAGDALVPDGAIVGRGFGTTWGGPVGSCATQGTIHAWDVAWLDATTDASTTTGSASDLASFSKWPTQLNGVRDGFLAANPGAALSGRWLAWKPPVLQNVLFFTQTDGSLLHTSAGNDPTAPPPWELCGPQNNSTVLLGLSADNPDTAADEGGIPLLTCTAAGTQVFREFVDRNDTPPGDPVVLEDTAICSPNTPAGNNVSVPLNGGTQALAGIDVTFSQVTAGGSTTVVTTTTGPPPPTAFNIIGLAGAPLYFDITTTAAFTGDVNVCMRYDDAGLTPAQEADLKLMQNVGGNFVDRTTSVDTTANVICGTASSFSVWAVVLPPPDIDGDGIPNADDACPQHAGPPERDGCPPPGPPAVGGIAGLLDDGDNAEADTSDSSGGDRAVPLVAAAGFGALALAVGAWHARRRWIR